MPMLKNMFQTILKVRMFCNYKGCTAHFMYVDVVWIKPKSGGSHENVAENDL